MKKFSVLLASLSFVIIMISGFAISAQSSNNGSYAEVQSHDWTCDRCNGSGHDPQIKCRTCRGTGMVEVEVVCNTCNGNGVILDQYGKTQTCWGCNGKGRNKVTRYCSACDGYGTVKCNKCGGTGRVRSN